MSSEPIPLTFRNVVQRDCYQQVRALVHRLYPDAVREHADRPAFTVSQGSTAADVTVYAAEDDAVVHVRALVVRGATHEADLLETLLRQNARLVHGAFSIAGNGDIVFTHTTPAVAVSEAKLGRELAFVLEMADHFDDFIQGQWGGRRTVDCE